MILNRSRIEHPSGIKPGMMVMFDPDGGSMFDGVVYKVLGVQGRGLDTLFFVVPRDGKPLAGEDFTRRKLENGDLLYSYAFVWDCHDIWYEMTEDKGEEEDDGVYLQLTKEEAEVVKALCGQQARKTATDMIASNVFHMLDEMGVKRDGMFRMRDQDGRDVLKVELGWWE